MKNDQEKELWQSLVRSSAEYIEDHKSENTWVGQNYNKSQVTNIINDLEQNLKTLDFRIGNIFQHMNVQDTVKTSVIYVENLKDHENASDLTSMVIYAMKKLGVIDHDMVQAVILASILGEISNRLEYHNNAHYRKVLLQTLNLIVTHNQIFEETQRELSQRQCALLLIAACIHDLAHDGLGNTIKGVFTQGRAEMISFREAEPFLRGAGLSNKECNTLKTLILCTDVNPLGDPANLNNQMKSAYKKHILRGMQNERLNLDPIIADLEDNADLSVMGLLLHEADIATSAALSYDVTKYETSLYQMEINGAPARPSHILKFLESICHRQFISDAGQRLYAASAARIYALAEKEVEQGDEVFDVIDPKTLAKKHTPKNESSASIN